MPDKYPCPDCRKDITATKNNRYRSHSDGDGEPCKMSSDVIPEHVLFEGPADGSQPADVPVAGVDYQTCPQCDRKVKLTRLGYFEPHDETLKGGDRCPVSGVRAVHARKITDVSLPELNESDRSDATSPTKELPPIADGPDEDEQWQDHMAESVLPVSSGASTETPSPESLNTSSSSPEPETTPWRTESFSLAPGISSKFRQPWSPFLQPPEWKEPRLVFLQPPEWKGNPKPEPMDGLAAEIATRVKETFYAYSNRRTSDNRSAQTTLGPSEIGTPCDRRLAMSLMNVPPVNPGGDGWAAFVGTCGHTGMEDVFTWADAGTGRYVVELKLAFPSALVPKGTTDILDRRDGTIGDWKFMGDYSLKKFKLEGPSDTYRVQAHTYGLGATLKGEKVKNVAIIGLPRAGSSLDDMHVWAEKYDGKIALRALKRVEEISQKTRDLFQPDRTRLQAAQEFAAADDCRYCPFFRKGDSGFTQGCPGK